MGQPYLNCFDKAALALAMLDIGEVTSFDVYVSKWFMSLGISMDVLLTTLILKKLALLGLFQ
jgi:hypothetical protein